MIGPLSGVEVSRAVWLLEHRKLYVDNHPSDNFKAAIVVGTIRIGMSMRQVRAALNLDPYGSGYAYRTYRSVDSGGTFVAWEVHTLRNLHDPRLPHRSVFTAYFQNDLLTSWVE